MDPEEYLQQSRFPNLNVNAQYFTGMKNETQTPPITTPNPSEYIYNSSSPPLMHRRTSVASSLSWDSGCDESLPSTPEGTLGDYSTAPIQLSYTDSLMMDEDDNDDVYPSNGSAIPHGIAVAPKLLSLPEYPQCQPPIPHHDNHHPHHQQHHHTAHQNPIDHYRHHHQQLQQLKQQQQQEEQQQRQQLQQRQKQQQQQQQQQQHDPSSMDMEMDIKMRSRSECEEPLQLQHPQYRKSNSLDSGLDYSRHRYPGFNDSVEMSDSPQSLVYSPDRYHPPSPEYQTHLHPTPTTPTTTAMLDYPATNCGDAALSALHLCYYAASPLMPMQYHQIQRRKPTSPTKKTKGTGLGRLPVVVSNNDKPHVCSIGTCNARFKRQEHLRRHERTHTDERPFDCDICGRKFSRTDNLRMHRKTHMKKTGRNLFVPGLE